MPHEPTPAALTDFRQSVGRHQDRLDAVNQEIEHSWRLWLESLDLMVTADELKRTRLDL
jgi:hypothetical protein